MKRQNGWILTIITAATIIGSAVQVQAIPVFARKYGFNCTTCHSNFPRLNDFGVRYRQNGYQLPGRENEEKTVLESPTPIAMRTSAGYNYNKFENTSDSTDVNQFQLNGLDILSAGLIGPNIGYMLVYPPQIEGSRGVVAQTGVLEMASVVFSNIGSTMLNVRAGRFEPAYVAFSAKRMLSVSSYEIYDFAFPGGSAFSDTRTGIELTGYDRQGFSYATGLVNGSNSATSTDGTDDVYLRVSKVFGAGEGQTAGQRIGLLGYSGRGRGTPGSVPTLSTRESYSRFSLDASLNFDRFNFAAQYLHGKDNKALWGTASDVKFSGGFAELSYMPSTSIVGFTRYECVNTGDLDQDVKRWTVGGRYYFQDNIALHLEYSDRNQNQPGFSDATERFFTTRLDFAF
ncbi:MAG: hypothetical protein WCL39_01715 [Armatimonadota bacterium]